MTNFASKTVEGCRYFRSWSILRSVLQFKELFQNSRQLLLIIGTNRRFSFSVAEPGRNRAA